MKPIQTWLPCHVHSSHFLFSHIIMIVHIANLITELSSQFTRTSVYIVFQLLDNYMQRTKKKLADDKLQLHKTGGGMYISQINELDMKLMSLMGLRATPLRNPFDGDSSYNNEGLLSFETACWGRYKIVFAKEQVECRR